MKRAAALLLAAGLAACANEKPEPAPSPSATVAAPRTLIAADFDTLTLGARIKGPQGYEVATALSAGSREIGRMVSYVVCPEAVTDCNPAVLPEGTVFTYVHRITLAEANESPLQAEASDATPAQTGATLFRTTRPVAGFNHAIGYSKSEARAALGEADAISITSDEGRLIWRVTKGEGWTPGSTITFWWTSTVPPKGPEKAYAIEIDGKAASATGPFPADKTVERGSGR